MLRFEKVATPFTAFTVVVPESVPAMSGLTLPLWPMAIVTWPLNVVAWVPSAFSTVTWTGGIVSSGIVVRGWALNPRCSGGGRRKVVVRPGRGGVEKKVVT